MHVCELTIQRVPRQSSTAESRNLDSLASGCSTATDHLYISERVAGPPPDEEAYVWDERQGRFRPVGPQMTFLRMHHRRSAQPKSNRSKNMYTNNGNTRTVNVHKVGTGQTLQTQVGPSTTMAEVLQQMGLVATECDVASPTGDRLLSLEEKPWDIVQSPQDSIAVSPIASVG